MEQNLCLSLDSWDITPQTINLEYFPRSFENWEIKIPFGFEEIKIVILGVKFV